MTAYPNLLHRYPAAEGFSSALALDEDLLDLAHGLTSRGVVEQLLRERHGWSGKEVKATAVEIASHVMQGLLFWDQAKSGPRGVSFLPYYYAFLQFAKAVVHAKGGPSGTKSMLRHGLSYPVSLKNSRTIDSEVIQVWPQGVFAEYYRVLVQDPLPDFRRKKNRKQSGLLMTVQMDNIYPFVVDASYEYGRAVGQAPWFAEVAVQKVAEADGIVHFKFLTNARELPRPSSPLFRVPPVGSDEFSCASGHHPTDLVPTYLLWLPLGVDQQPFNPVPFSYLTPKWNGRLRYPEEVPLFLAFFHLGSVVRYKPRFLESVMDSRYLPFLRALERHGSTKILLLFINAMHDVSHIPT